MADHVLTLSVLPSSLRIAQRAEDVYRVEEEVAAMVATVPPELVAELSRIQLLVDSYGEDLAAQQTSTAAPGAQQAQFDDAALEESLETVKGWLVNTCTESGRGG